MLAFIVGVRKVKEESVSVITFGSVAVIEIPVLRLCTAPPSESIMRTWKSVTGFGLGGFCTVETENIRGAELFVLTRDTLSTRELEVY